MERACGSNGKRSVAGKFSIKISEGMRARGRPRSRRKHNIKWIFRKSV
jgi:hypothetical protein